MNAPAVQPALRLDDFPQPVRGRLAEIGELGRRRGEPVHLVGGLVRDLLLARPSLDVDIAVEGDGPGFAAELAAKLGVPLRVHREFGTAQLDDSALGSLDVATARRESYAAPAALPKVEPAGIVEDLARRDFAVNAMALRLDAEAFLDPWEGLGDFETKGLRVLHPRSFVDDPTRILRGVRLGSRLGWHFAMETEILAREGIAAGVFGPLSGSRLAAELELLAETEDALLRDALDRLAELGFFETVLGVPPPAQLPMGPVPDRFSALLLALGRGHDESALADRLHLTGERRACLVGAGERARRARTTLSRPDARPHQAHQSLASLSLEEVALLTAEPPPVGLWATREMTEMRPLTIAIQGRDLVAHGVLPGPKIGEILQEVRRARLDGEIGPGEEKAKALALAGVST